MIKAGTMEEIFQSLEVPLRTRPVSVHCSVVGRDCVKTRIEYKIYRAEYFDQANLRAEQKSKKYYAANKEELMEKCKKRRLSYVGFSN